MLSCEKYDIGSDEGSESVEILSSASKTSSRRLINFSRGAIRKRREKTTRNQFKEPDLVRPFHLFSSQSNARSTSFLFALHTLVHPQNRTPLDLNSPSNPSCVVSTEWMATFVRASLLQKLASGASSLYLYVLFSLL